ncbi:Glucarate dehydratase [Coniochaeta hoffmannii]|uniref:Glucarate dehydratase n=1 Tax=Coniochaeta hoffmannii TaxID=91930 RepID=A0AA38VBK0_9PEZI|nr:Glucarate dehydratase [Coniochaeta hoffmannii]
MRFITAALAASYIALATAVTGPAVPGAQTRPEAKPTKMEDFKWSDPFSSSKIRKFSPSCSAEKSFRAREYLLDDLSEDAPKGLSPWADALRKIFKGRPYPGSWDGWDPHGYDRNLLMMEYAEVPVQVREWIEEQERTDGEGKGLFAVYEKPKDAQHKIQNVVKFPAKDKAPALRPLDKKRVVLFAPGALYDLLPLWVAEGSACKETLLDTSKYSPKLAEGAVIAWPVKYGKANRKKDERDIEFTIKAQVLQAKAEGSDEASRDEL